MTAPESEGPDSPDPVADAAASDGVALIRTPAVLCLIVGIICTVIGGVLDGGKGVLGGVLGTIVVIGFFAGGQIIVGRVLRSNPALGLNVALLVYVAQIGILFLLLLLLRNASFFAPKVFAFTVMVCVLTWVVGAIVGFTRQRQLTVVPGSGPPGGPSAGRNEPDITEGN